MPAARASGFLRRAAPWAALFLLPLLAILLVLAPALLMQPLRPQSALDVQLGHFLAQWGVGIALGIAAGTGLLATRTWKGSRRRWSRAILILPVALAGFGGWLSFQNPIDWIFSPFDHPQYARAATVSFVPDSAMVMSVERNGDAVAFPIQQMAYHHIVDDSIGGERVLVTYCVLCRTGQVFRPTLDGEPMTFRMMGTNNQNFIMQDDRTGSWWQQATGTAVVGPLKGRSLEIIHHDQLSFALWKTEHPNGRVLRPEPDKEENGEYAVNWDRAIARIPVFPEQITDTRLDPRDVVFGLRSDGPARAWPQAALKRDPLILDNAGETPIAVVLADDGASVRAFERIADGRELELFRKPDTVPLRLVDAETGSEWDFTGLAVAGPLAGHRLRPITLLRLFWFEWSMDHPETELYARATDNSVG